MAVPPFRVRWIGGIAVLGVGPNAAGDPVPPDAGLTTHCAGNRGVVLDFAGYKLVSSEFIGHLIRAHQAAMASGSRLRVCCPDGLARQVLSEVKLERVLPIFATLAEALADFDRDPPVG
jgi:anti-anti-sigma regulatory factor